MLHKLDLINREQRGFTLIELMVAIAITGLIISGVAVAIYQTISINASASNRMVAVNQVQNAGYWVSRDAEMAQVVELSEGPPEENPVGTKFPLTLTWTDWDCNVHVVVYTLENMTGGPKQLKRSHSINGGEATVNIIAKYLVPGLAKTSCQLTGSRLILTVTASVGGFMPESETRIYEVNPRPGI